MRTDRSLLRSIFVAAAVASGISGVAHAAEEGKATMTFNLPGLTYGSGNSEDKPDSGTSTKAKSSNLTTQDLEDSYAMIGFGSCAVYFYPFNDLHVLSFGYLPSAMFEVGLDLGLNNRKVDKPKDESNSTLIGVYGFAYPKLGSMDSEFGLIIDSTTTKGTTTTVNTSTGAETEGKISSTGMSEKLVANVIVPIRKNLNYVGGVFYKMNSDEDKEAKVKTTSSGFGLNLLTMRMTID